MDWANVIAWAGGFGCGLGTYAFMRASEAAREKLREPVAPLERATIADRSLMEGARLGMVLDRSAQTCERKALVFGSDTYNAVVAMVNAPEAKK